MSYRKENSYIVNAWQIYFNFIFLSVNKIYELNTNSEFSQFITEPDFMSTKIMKYISDT